MTDRRETPSNGRVAHVSLRGRSEADRFVEGERRRVTAPVTAIRRGPDAGTPRERELVFGEGFLVLDEEGDYAFGMAERDGYVGYVLLGTLGRSAAEPTHRAAVRSYAKARPELKSGEEVMQVSPGALVRVSATHPGGWTEIDDWTGPEGAAFFVPSVHLAPLGKTETDPVAVAERFLGTPYLWGGNSHLGIDCSGLVQVACLACGIPCPGDSDQQEAHLGTRLPEDESLRRGDLVFWPGHVAWVADAARLLHANAHSMSVAYEEIEPALARIDRQGDGPVTSRRRL
ncbi:C40 family peptidase [Histidinibacterium aquaticum]|uniref:NlpC/P60 family protein n=1 Tax=Histidinibacterium aquaticum TaxID=2613962 RepID=A0A5J5GFP8_9RHOB|nr:NlpC/P60 family protein [Histidinibacterium aquaticum]KAA9007005.1 NlpC/P60 family protein [Histidinibacterium aquaticum]